MFAVLLLVFKQKHMLLSGLVTKTRDSLITFLKNIMFLILQVMKSLFSPGELSDRLSK